MLARTEVRDRPLQPYPAVTTTGTLAECQDICAKYGRNGGPTFHADMYGRPCHGFIRTTGAAPDESARCYFLYNCDIQVGSTVFDLYLQERNYTIPVAPGWQWLGAHVVGDPHVKRLDGTSFDVDKPGMYTYLKIPQNGNDFQLNAIVQRNPAEPDKVYNKAFKFTGSWVGGEVKVDVDGVHLNDAFVSLDDLFEAGKVIELTESTTLTPEVCDFSEEAKTTFCETQAKARKRMTTRKERFMHLEVPGAKVVVQFAKNHLDLSFELVDRGLSMGGLLASTVEVRKSTPAIARSTSAMVM